MVICMHGRRGPRRMAHQQQQRGSSNSTATSTNNSIIFDGYHGNGTHQRDPPPYPGHFTQFYTPGYRQSYSGSETSTDLSISSSENLSLSTRQDPQGEENTQYLPAPQDGLDADCNYSILSRLGGLPTSGVEVKSSNPGTFYVTGSPSRSSSTSPPQSDINDISSILQFIASTGAPSYTAVSPSESCTSNGGGIYSVANQYLQQVPLQYQLPQQQQPHELQHQQSQHDVPRKLQRPKSANVPLTKDVVRDLQQQASRFLEEQCQQYIQAQNQGHCLQQQQQQQYQEQQQQLQQQQQLYNVGYQHQHHQDLFLPSHFFGQGGGFFQEPLQQQQQQQQQQSQQVVTQAAVHNLIASNSSNPKSQFEFNSGQGQQNQAYTSISQNFQSLPPNTSTPLITNACTSQVNGTKVTSSISSSSAQSSGNTSPSYVAIPPPLPLPPEGFSLNRKGSGNSKPALQRQSSGGHLIQKSKPRQNVQPQLKVKPLSGGDQAQPAIINKEQQQSKPEQVVSQEQHQEYPPPPQYSGVVASIMPQTASQHQLQSEGQQQQQQQQQRELRRSFEMLERIQNLTRSQPDLTKLLEKQQDVPKLLALGKTDCNLPIRPHSAVVTPAAGEQKTQVQDQLMQRQLQQPQAPQQVRVQQQQAVQQAVNHSIQLPPAEQSTQSQLDFNHAMVASRATQMVERLSHENHSLRKQLQGYYGKLSKLQKFEMEIKKIGDAYENLVRHSQKRENLEKLMRLKLDSEMKKFKAVNQELKEQLDRALSQLQQKDFYNLSDTDLRREINKKDSMISKLLSQNKEMTSAKERLEIEGTAQRSTLQEQRSHIEILDKALNNAQTSIVRLEEELRKKIIQDEKIEDLQRAVSQLQLAAAKREAVEQRLRNKLEEEIRNLKEQHHISISKASDTDEGIASDCESTTGSQYQGLLQQLREKDHRILALESEVLKWEQRYLEESALRHVAVDAASMPKDMRIAALEQSSAETEKVIADARTERLKHLEEVYQANRRAAELESQVKSQAAQLAERDAMISVLQKHCSLGGSSRTSSVTSLLSSPLHSPLPTLNSPLPTSLSSLITSTVASIMSLSQSLPSSGTTSPSRQESVLSTDSNVFNEAKDSNTHAKSNSTGSTASSVGASTEAFRDLQQRIAAQAALLHNMQQKGGDQLSKVLWQV